MVKNMCSVLNTLSRDSRAFWNMGKGKDCPKNTQQVFIFGATFFVQATFCFLNSFYTKDLRRFSDCCSKALWRFPIIFRTFPKINKVPKDSQGSFEDAWTHSRDRISWQNKFTLRSRYFWHQNVGRAELPKIFVWGSFSPPPPPLAPLALSPMLSTVCTSKNDD